MYVCIYMYMYMLINIYLIDTCVEGERKGDRERESERESGRDTKRDREKERGRQSKWAEAMRKLQVTADTTPLTPWNMTEDRDELLASMAQHSLRFTSLAEAQSSTNYLIRHVRLLALLRMRALFLSFLLAEAKFPTNQLIYLLFLFSLSLFFLSLSLYMYIYMYTYTHTHIYI